MRTTSFLLLSSLSPTLLASVASAEEQCFGYTPMSSITTFLGSSLDYDTAQRICCNNHRYAEYQGYLDAPEVDLFSKLDPTVETVFYDSVCGIPLFIAPRGRTFEEFKAESLKHGWPSFRPEEIVSENVIIHEKGRMESRCLTHLGHNLPEGGVDRYCIDLVCMAGEPLTTESSDERAKILLQLDESVISHIELDPDTYVSSAEQSSGRYNNWAGDVLIVGVVLASVLIAAIMVAYGVSWKKRKANGKEKDIEQQSTQDNMSFEIH